MDNNKIESGKLEKLLTQFHKSEKRSEEKSKEEIFDSLLNQLNISNHSFSNAEIENIISNYIFITESIRKDLQEIDERLVELRELDKSTPKDDDYKHKKYRYFAELNRNAKEQIMEFYSFKLFEQLLESRSYKYIDRENDSLTMLFFSGRYDYAQFRKYYDFKYDFSTEAKIRFIPGIELGKEEKVIQRFIKLKDSSLEDYNNEIERMVEDNKIVEYIRDKIKYNHYLSKRSEMFETLVSLYSQNKYQTFIALAVIQLEGLFYDCCSIIDEKELGNKAGTLVEKAQKVFSSKPVLQMSVYPYFAFDVPDLRNEVAHNGMISNKELKSVANNIVLDLYTLVYWACHLSNNKYIPLVMIMDKIKDVQTDDARVVELLFLEMFQIYQISGGKFIEVLKEPSKYKTEIDFYEPQDKSDDVISLNEVVLSISNKIKSETFWLYVLSIIDLGKENHRKGKPYDLIDFILKLKNTFIPVLREESPEKIACQDVAKRLNQIDSIG